MVKKLLVAGAGAIAIAGALLLGASPASAHHPEVAVEVCPGPEQLQDVVDVTAYAFEVPEGWTEDHRVNSNVRVDVTGPGVALSATGAFAAPDYSFTTSFVIPDAVGKTLTVRVTALAQWGPDQQYPSTQDWAETTITVPLCAGGTTTTTVAPTSTSVAPSTTTAPTTTVPTEVGGITDVNPQVPSTADQSAQLAFSGNETLPTLLAGAGLLAVGGGLLLGARRRRDA